VIAIKNHTSYDLRAFFSFAANKRDGDKKETDHDEFDSEQMSMMREQNRDLLWQNEQLETKYNEIPI